MTPWLVRPSSGRKTVHEWADEVASVGMQEKSSNGQSASSRGTRHTASSTVVEEPSGLPVPVVQPNRYSINHRKRKTARFGRLKTLWVEFKTRLGTGSAPSSSSVHDESAVDSACLPRRGSMYDDDTVDEVVVDRVWTGEFHSTPSHSDPEDVIKSKSGSNQHPAVLSDSASTIEDHPFWDRNAVLIFLRYRVWRLLMEIFASRFEDEKKEQHYRQEEWYMKKSLAVVTSIWLIISWALGCALSKLPSRTFTIGDQIFFFAVASVFTIPLIVMVIYDWPRDRSHIYQVTVLCAVWCWSFYNIIYMRACGYYTPGSHQDSVRCEGRDFMATFYYATALQTIGLFGLKMNRFPAAIGALSWFLFSCIAIIPLRPTWIRVMLNFLIFHFFLIYVHYVRELSERRLYTLRDQLKIQFKATQKAQINERKASDSKRRLTSYVFHDEYYDSCTLRGGLADFLCTGPSPIEHSPACGAEYGSLRDGGSKPRDRVYGSKRELDDDVKSNRLDSGKFESASKPYPFHHVMRSLLNPLRLNTDAKGLQFETYLDPNIDKLARRLAYEALGQSRETIRKHILDNPEVDGVVTGDEARLQQIVNNLATNACKFTPAGGKITIKTKLVLPRFGDEEDPLDVIFGYELPNTQQQQHQQNGSGSPTTTGAPAPAATGGNGNGVATEGQQTLSPPPLSHRPLSANYLSQHNFDTSEGKRSVEHIVVRIEVSDTGCGIKMRDMMQNKLFSAFNQTEQGIQQGGKGTGLGLALVRQIVKVTGGRLGVKSKQGEGSTFWVELPLGVGKRTLQTGPASVGLGASTPPSETSRARADTRIGAPPGLFEMNDHHHQHHHLHSPKPRSETHHEHQTFYSLMEQGRVLDPKSRNNDSQQQPPGTVAYGLPSRVSSDDSAPLIPGEVERQLSLSSPLPPPVYRPYSDPESVPLPEPRISEDMELGELTPTNNPNPGGQSLRPTYVPLPSPRSFSSHSMENQPPPTSSTWQTSSSSMSGNGNGNSPMTAFDACFTHGSPASSNSAVNVEYGLNVLVVDDDFLTRALMTRILTRLGCKVTTAENGEMAIDLILGTKGYGVPGASTPGKEIEVEFGRTVPENEVEHLVKSLGPAPQEIKFAVVFLDNQMPVMSGVKAVERLRELGRKDFVVGVTGNALLSDQQEYLSAGADRILTKPVLERSLREILTAAEERRKSITKNARSSLNDSPPSSSQLKDSSKSLYSNISHPLSPEGGEPSSSATQKATIHGS